MRYISDAEIEASLALYEETYEEGCKMCYAMADEIKEIESEIEQLEFIIDEYGLLLKSISTIIEQEIENSISERKKKVEKLFEDFNGTCGDGFF